MLPSVTSPKMSDATDVVMFMLRRCSMIALALPSRSLETVNACSWIVSPRPAGSVLVRLISRVATWPAVTVKVSVTVV